MSGENERLRQQYFAMFGGGAGMPHADARPRQQHGVVGYGDGYGSGATNGTGAVNGTMAVEYSVRVRGSSSSRRNNSILSLRWYSCVLVGGVGGCFPPYISPVFPILASLLVASRPVQRPSYHSGIIKHISSVGNTNNPSVHRAKHHELRNPCTRRGNNRFREDNPQVGLVSYGRRHRGRYHASSVRGHFRPMGHPSAALR